MLVFGLFLEGTARRSESAWRPVPSFIVHLSLPFWLLGKVDLYIKTRKREALTAALERDRAVAQPRLLQPAPTCSSNPGERLEDVRL
jgi:hypothetical protein